MYPLRLELTCYILKLHFVLNCPEEVLVWLSIKSSSWELDPAVAYLLI
jgi:hypothetical protein